MSPYEHVENIIKTSSKSFYKAFSYLPEEKAKAVYAIYGFCRVADDAVDEENNPEKLKDLEKKLKSLFQGQNASDPLFIALQDTFKKFPSEIKPYLDLLAGLKKDYETFALKTEKEFDEYCYSVASTVGLMLLPVIAQEKLKTDKEKLTQVAIELGKAMQITNILRDVKEDLEKNRLYLPEEALKKYNVLEKTLRTGTLTPEYKALIIDFMDRAHEKYQVFYDHAHLFDKEALKPTYLSAKFYQGILYEIEKRGYDNLTKRVYVSTFKKWKLMRQAHKELAKKGL
jgi:phytoene synthase